MSQITIFEVPAGADPLNEGANDTWGANGIQIWNRISIDSNTVYFSQNVQANTLLVGGVTINSTALAVGNLVIMGNTILGSSNSSVNVSANAVIVGNSTVNATVNSTFYSATSNNTLYVGSTSAANVVSNAQLITNLANYALLSGAIFSGQVNTGNLNVIGDATFSGNVTFASGTKITPVSLVTTDKNLILANGDITGLTANGAGIIITNVAEWIYDNANNAWISNVNIQAVNISGTLTTASQPNITANNSTNLGGTPASGYQTTAGLAANVATLTSNNSTYLAGYGLGTFQTAAGLSANVLTLTANNTQFVGTVSAANVVSNAQLIANLANYSNTTQITTTLGGYQTTAGLGANVATLAANSALFANNSTYFNGQPAGFYANVTNPTISGNVTIGISGNTIAINATSITIGNSTVNATINSTAFSGFTTSTSENANNSNYLGGVAAASYQLNSTLAANVATLTANNSTNFGGNPVSYFANITSPIHTTSMAVGANVVANTTAIFLGNSTVNTTVNSTVFTGTANNATNLGGVAATGYQTTAGLAANVATLTSNNTTFFNGQTTAYFANVTSPVITTTMEVGAVGNNVTVNTTAILLGNSTVFSTVNSTFHSATANNALYLNGTAAAGYQTTAGLSANVATLSANNSSYLGTVAAASYVQNTDSRTLSGNLAHTAANTYIANLNVVKIIGNNVLGTTGQALLSNSTGGIYWGAAGGSFDPTAQYTFTNTQIFSNSVAFNGANTYIANLNALQIIANGVLGTATQVLTSNATGGLYWGTAGGGSGANTANQYIWSNTQTFQNTITFSSIVTVGAVGNNVTANTTAINIGNSTVNSTVNSTIFTGTANNATNLGGTAAASYQLNSTLSANVATLTSNNSTNFAGQGQAFYANVTTPVITTTLEVGAVGNNVTVNTTAILLGNSTVFSTVNSSVYSGTANNATNLGGVAASGYQTTAGLSANVATLTSNNSTNFGGNPVSFYANVTSPIITTTMEVGAVGNNVTVNTTAILLGNSTVFSTVNSTIFSGTANNATNLGGVAAASYQTVAGMSSYQTTAGLAANVATLTANNSSYLGGTIASGYQTTAGLAANVTTLTANNTLFVGTVSAANVVSNTQLSANLGNYQLTSGMTAYQTTVGLSANVATLSSNNASYLGTVAAASYQLNSTLAANVATMTANNSTNFAGQGQSFYANVTSPVFTTTTTVGGVANSVVANTTTLTIGNSTVNTTVNSTVYSGTANNATNLGGTAAAGYQTTAGLSANVATLTSNNASYLGTVAAASYVQNTDSRTLSGNLNFSAANTRIANLNVGQVIANGVLGIATQVLTSNATGGVYWATGGGGSFDATAQYTFTNTLVFSNSVAFNGTNTYVANLNSLHIIANGVLGTATQVLQSNSTGGIFWGAASGSFDPTQQYVFTNTDIFSNTITFGNSSVNTVIGWNVTDQSVFESIGNVNNFVEIGLYNSNTGNNASADFIINDTGGTAPLNNNYIDVGINGTGFLQSTWTINGPSDAYVYTGNTNLSIGTLAQNYLNFFANGTLANNEVMRITANGVNIGNSNTTVAKLVVGNTTINTTINSTSITANLFISSNGIYVTNTFSGTFVDGVVVDYLQAANGIVRISGGLNDHMIFYNGGVANAMMMKIDGYTGVLSLSMNNPSVSFANATQSMAPVPTLGIAYAISSGFALV